MPQSAAGIRIDPPPSLPSAIGAMPAATAAADPALEPPEVRSSAQGLRVVGNTGLWSDGTASYDYKSLTPELAESWEVAGDGMSAAFKLRPNAVFHDGSPVTAADVKWSFDRAVQIGGFSPIQMGAGSMEKPEQFEASAAVTGLPS